MDLKLTFLKNNPAPQVLVTFEIECRRRKTVFGEVKPSPQALVSAEIEEAKPMLFTQPRPAEIKCGLLGVDVFD